MDRAPFLASALLLIAAAPLASAQSSPAVAAQLEGVHLKLEPDQRIAEPVVDPASDAAEKAISHFKLPPELQAKLWAAEPMLADPVAMGFNEKGQLYIAETHRYRSSVLDIRSYMGMLEADLASRTIEDRSKLIHSVFGEDQAKQFAIESELVRVIEDRSGKGVADHSDVFATGFNSELDGIGAGVLARKGKIWYSNIPSLWLLESDPTGLHAVKRTELLRGFGVHFNYTGHDFHGLIFGPDGKIYMSIGDRGTHVVNREGKVVDVPDTGAVYRCDPDGSNFEIFATGLRNPQELAFDEHGNLFTGDNDCDYGDEERLENVVEGGDYGWRIGYQHNQMVRGGPWMTDDLWKPRYPGEPAYLIPPICNIEDGPSGVAYYPGTGLTHDYAHTFFICHFKGTITRSGVQTYNIKPSGAGFQIVDSKTFLSGMLPTDVTFGPDGNMYVVDWVEGWPKSNKGRVYSIVPKDESQQSIDERAEVKKLFAEGFDKRSNDELVALLGHRDQRIRQEAQFELTDRGAASVAIFENVAKNSSADPLARIHALWGLGQLAKQNPTAIESFQGLLADKDEEVRAQAAKLLGDHKVGASYEALIKHLQDPSARVVFFAAQSLGKLGRADATSALLAVAKRNADTDVYLRHAVVYALTQFGATPALAKGAKDSSSSVRLAALLVYRRLGDAKVAEFLRDSDPFLVREAALAINDAPVPAAFPALAAELKSGPLSDHMIMLRAINAHFRLGGEKNATALAQFAVRSDVPEKLRVEALAQLALWGTPPARDRLVGVFRPLPERSGEPAAAALQPSLVNLLHHSSTAVATATVEAIENLKMKSANAELASVVADEAIDAEVRALALQALDKADAAELNNALMAAANTKASAPKLAALQIQARRAPSQALPIIEHLATEGTDHEQRAAFTALSKLDPSVASAQLVAALDRLSAGKVPVGSQAELLDAAQKSPAPDVKAKYAQITGTWTSSGDTLAPFRSALEGGNVSHGRFLFQQNPTLACIRCHKVAGEGGDAGPDLTLIGAKKSPEYLLESVVKPNAKIAEGFDLQTITLKDGSFQSGTFVRETPDDVVLKKPDGTEFNVARAQIARRQSAPSAMPEIFGQVFTRTELRDVIAYLESLNKAPKMVAMGDEGPRALAALRPAAPRKADEPSDNGEAPTSGH
ncbi:MAG TPA: HEAT repeat domain-containing protein [Opitutaceae bacterium]